MELKVTVVGAGFSGLSIAYYLLKNGYQVTILEKSKQVAGLLQSPCTEFGIIEHAANGLINSKGLIELCSEIGIELIYPGSTANKKFLFNKGKVTRWPFGFFETLSLVKKIFKFKKNKLLFEPKNNETLDHWVKRVFSSSVLNKLVEPAFQGVYASCASNLSASLVTKNLFKNTVKNKSKGVKRQTVGFTGGMNSFCKKMSEYLRANGVEIKLGADVTTLSLEHLNILTCDSKSAAKILTDINHEVSQDLNKLNKISIAKLSCFTKKTDNNPEGFGCLFPKNEGFNSLGVLFDSSIFPNRYKDHSLQTWILGSDLIKPGVDKKILMNKVKQDMKKLWGKDIDIAHTDIKIWESALPVYDITLEAFLVKYNLDTELIDNLYLFSNYTGSLGLSQILDKAKEMATRINYEQTK